MTSPAITRTYPVPLDVAAPGALPAPVPPTESWEDPPHLDDTRLATGRRLARRRTGRGPFFWSGVLLLALAGIAFLPWQQSVSGKGTLTTLDPADRPQTVPAIIAGRVAEWQVAEGAFVKKGQLLARLTEVKDGYLDPTTIDRYREQLAAKRASVTSKRDKARALEAQIAALESGRGLALERARNDVLLYRAAVDAAVADSAVAADQAARRARLAADGLASTNDLQGARLKAQAAAAKAVEKRAELANAELKLGAVDADYGEKLAKARADRSATLADASDGEAESSKLRNAVDNLVLRNGLYDVVAPQDGWVVRTLRAGVGEQVKEGEALVTVMPSSSAARPLAAAVSVRAVDVPLVSRGRHVRLQFDGWPALQVSGWPRAAVGTFGGIVAVVDPVAQPDGTFRVLVTPDPKDEPWPAQLRQGSGVVAWAMLDRVPLGYELWRRVNGFPQSVAAPPGEAGAGKGK